MQEPTLAEIHSRSFNELIEAEADHGPRDLVRKLEAQSIVDSQIEAMKAAGKVLALTDEEIDMLRSFRRFKLRMRKDGRVFTWQSRRPEGIQITDETVFVLHPSEHSST